MTTELPDLGAAMALANRMADMAGAIALRHFRTPLDVIAKADESPVTVADREVESALRAVLAEAAPADGIYGEEHGQERVDAPFVWVIDPIDGTRSFITGSPLWGTLIGLLHHGRPVLGMIDIPFTRERWSATASIGACLGGVPVRASGCERLADARLYATSPDIFVGRDRDAFAAVEREAGLRRFGGDCYSYGLLASGHVDLVVESGLQPYDYLPIAPIIAAAGGVITDWNGEPLGLGSDGRVVAAATPALHAAALKCIVQARA